MRVRRSPFVAQYPLEYRRKKKIELASYDMRATDAELLQRWRGGDLNSGDALFERYYDSIERFFLNKVGFAVTDLVQETFARCTAGQQSIRDCERFRMFLFGVAYNVLKEHIRAAYRRNGEIDIDSMSLARLDPGQSTLFARRREERMLLEAMRQLPIADQVIIELHYWEDLNTDELAAVLRIPVGTARGRLQRAREKVAKRMQEIAASPQDLTTTLACLRDWANDCRKRLQDYEVAGIHAAEASAEAAEPMQEDTSTQRQIRTRRSR